MFEIPEQNVCYSGGSGYGLHFKTIGEQFGSVDLTVMENDQYDQDWKFAHMMPEETVQAAADLHAKAASPGHTGRFVLVKYTWDDPHKQLALASRRQDC